MSAEVWRVIPTFPLYEVSNYGRVRSLSRTYVREHWKNSQPHIVTTRTKLIGGWVKYRNGVPMALMVSLRRDRATITDRVHRLVLTAFVGPCQVGMEGCHNDGNPLNNQLGNLRWDTHTSNVADSVRHGTKTLPPLHIGEHHPMARLTDAQVLAIRAAKITRGVKASLARTHGVSQTTINRILTGAQRA